MHTWIKGALHTWIKVLDIHPSIQFIISFLALLAVLISLSKVFIPTINFNIESFYYTIDKEKHMLCILKLHTTSNVDLTLENVIINVTVSNYSKLKMIPYAFRWKGVFFKMLDMNNQSRDYKLLKPLEPDLRICGIKQGSNECYISMKSENCFEDMRIKSWTFELKYRQHLLPIPNIPLLDRKTITVLQPEGKDLYFDDSLFQKISTEERQKLMDEL